jgi:hypothetical protein
MTANRFKLGALLPITLSLLAAACGPAEGSGSAASASGAAIVIDELATFDSRFVEIDACPNVNAPAGFLLDTLGCSGANWADDANIYVGNDKDQLLKIDKTNVSSSNYHSESYAYPGPAGSTFIDWEELLSSTTTRPNHVRFDFSLGNAPDPTAFPQSNSCVGSAQVVPKMDITAVTVSNNATYAYFGVQRRGNDGDAGYMWLFTKKVPVNPPGGDDPGCGPTELRYRLTDGDVMFRGHFVPDPAAKLLFVYTIPAGTIVSGKTVNVDNTNFTAVCPGGSAPCYIEMPAKEAIDWQNGLWFEKSDGVAAAAVNTSPAGAGSLGLQGVSATMAPNDTFTTKADSQTKLPAYTWKCTDPAGCMQPYVFAEVAVPTSVFTGSSVCGATFYGSVITRPSGNQPSPDMKDLAGPYQFNFGSVSVTAAAVPSCQQQFGYRISSFGGLGAASPTSCSWSYRPAGSTGTFTPFDPDPDCSSFGSTYKYFGSLLLNGSYELKVTAGDGTCFADATTTVNVYPPVTAGAAMTGSCTLSFTYDGTAGGGSGSSSYAWSFSGPGTVTPSSSTSLDSPPGTSVLTSAAGSYSGTLKVTDNRPDIGPEGVCSATAPASASVYAPVTVTLGAKPSSLSCTPSSNDDIPTAATFTATASNGSGSYAYHWGGDCSGTSTSSNQCVVDDSTTCADKALSVYVTDAVCGNSGTPTGTYDKVTTITTSVTNPP